MKYKKIMRYKNILETVGNTPVVKVNNTFGNKFKVWAKLEKANPGGSIKDRIALAMIEDAEFKGLLKPNGVIVEPTSGNTGIGLAFVASVKGYRTILVMPSSMSLERRKLMKAYGAEIVLTPAEKGMKGAIEKAEEIKNSIDNSWIPQQFMNESNPEVHRRTTAQEIIKDFPEGIDYYVTGIGTGGHITGVGEELKKAFPNIKIYAVEPEDSAVLSGSTPGPHRIQGIGAGFVPDVLNQKVYDKVIKVPNELAFKKTVEFPKNEGIMIGISSGASLGAVEMIQDEIPEGATVLVMNYDTGERYLSIEDLF